MHELREGAPGSEGRTAVLTDPAREARRHHGAYLALCALAIVLSFLLEGNATQVRLAFLPGEPALPPLCPTKGWFDVECPGCGLTRSFVALAHGRVAEAHAQHPVGIALFLAALYQLWFRPWMIRRREMVAPQPLLQAHVWIARALIAALLVTWVVRMYSRYRG